MVETNKNQLGTTKSFSFENIEIAFASKSDSDLRRALLLFKLINSNFLVTIGKPLTRLALAIHLPIAGLIKGSIFKQFCGGETIEESVKTANRLGAYNVFSILDYSVEGLEEEETFNNTALEIMRTIQQASKNPNIPFSVFKVSGLGSTSILEKVGKGEPLDAAGKAGFQRIKERVNSICNAAYQAEVPIMIDAEESWIQPAIDSLATRMMHQYNTERAIVINTIQLYRHDRLEYLKESYRIAKNEGYFLGVKIVRGAYMEKERSRAKSENYPSPIQPDKAHTDRDYNLALEFCLTQARDILMISGTHNEKSCQTLSDLISKSSNLENKNIWFAQLLGMSDQLSFNLSSAGYNVCKYLPYGPLKGVLPYLFRRAEENTAIAGQMSREYTLIGAEIRRRRKIH